MSQAINENSLKSILLTAFKRQYKLDLFDNDWSVSWGSEELYGIPVFSLIATVDGKQTTISSKIEFSEHSRIGKFYISYADEDQVTYYTTSKIEFEQFTDLIAPLAAITEEATPLINTESQSISEVILPPKNQRLERKQQLPTSTINQITDTLIINGMDVIADSLTINFDTDFHRPTDLKVLIRSHTKSVEDEQFSWTLAGRIENCLSATGQSVTVKSFGEEAIVDVLITSLPGHIRSNIFSNVGE